MTTQSNPNVLFFVVAHIVNIPLRIKSLHQYVLEGEEGGRRVGGGDTHTRKLQITVSNTYLS